MLHQHFSGTKKHICCWFEFCWFDSVCSGLINVFGILYLFSVSMHLRDILIKISYINIGSQWITLKEGLCQLVKNHHPDHSECAEKRLLICWILGVHFSVQLTHWTEERLTLLESLSVGQSGYLAMWRSFFDSAEGVLLLERGRIFLFHCSIFLSSILYSSDVATFKFLFFSPFKLDTLLFCLLLLPFHIFLLGSWLLVCSQVPHPVIISGLFQAPFPWSSVLFTDDSISFHSCSWR